MDKKNIIAKRIAGFFDAPITSIFLDKDVVGHIEKMTFFRNDYQCLELSNEMVELSERLEEGVLVAETFRNMPDKSSAQKIVLSPEMQVEKTSLKFLLHEENGNTNPSGLLFKSFRGEENYVIVGAAPFTLAFLSGLYPESKSPEYDISEYRQENLEEQTLS
tara:strand:+ start:134 stop:619 length:486 start_codon:yes stop_codon:yes gene_type:complete